MNEHFYQGKQNAQSSSEALNQLYSSTVDDYFKSQQSFRLRIIHNFAISESTD